MQQTENLKLKIYDVSSDSMPAFINGVAGITDSNMTKIDEAITEKVKINGAVTNVNFISKNNAVKTIEVTDNEGRKTSFSLSTDMDTDHITTRTGHTEEERYTALLSQFGKNYISNGSDITVENGIENQRVLGAKIEGQTVKNEILGYGRTDSSFWSNATAGKVSYSNTYYSLVNSKYLVLRDANAGVVSSSIDLSKDYTFILEIKENPLESFMLTTHSGENVMIKKGFTGVKKFTGKIKSASQTLMNASNTITASEKPFVFRFMLIETKDVANVNSFFTDNIKSTQAIIINNGENYPIYEPTIQGKTKVMKAKKGKQDWVEISDAEIRDTKAYDYKLVNACGDLGSTTVLSDYIDLKRKVKVLNTRVVKIDGTQTPTSITKLTNTTRFSVKVDGCIKKDSHVLTSNFISLVTYNTDSVHAYCGSSAIWFFVSNTELGSKTPQQYLQETPVIVRYPLETPIEIPMTDEEIKQYDKYRKVIELNGVGGVGDTLEILEDGSGIYTQRLVERVLSETDVWLKERTENDVSMCFCHPKLAGVKPSTKNILSTHFVTKAVYGQGVLTEGIGMSGDYFYVRIFKNKLKTLDVDSFKEWLSSNKLCIVYELDKPVVTHIPKELVPAILTKTINEFSFSDAVKATSSEITVPVDNKVKLDGQATSVNFISTDGAIKTIETVDNEGHKISSSFATDTSHITDRTGRTQEDINRIFYKQSCKEFTSNGEDIVIDNGLNGYMLSGKMIGGQTVKNVLQPSDYNNKHLYPPCTFVDDYYIDGSKTRFNMFQILDIKFEVGKEYTLCVEIIENTLKKDTWQNTACIFGFRPKAGEVGVFYEKKTLTTLDNLKWIFYFTLAADYDSSVEKIKYRFWVTENGHSDTFCTGLSSTKAIISNNGEKYSFYNPIIEGKTYFMKAKKGTQEWVIDDISEERDFDKYDYKWDSPNGLHHVYKYRDKVDLEKREITTCIHHIELDDIIDNKFFHANLYPSTNTTLFSIPLDFTISVEAPQNYFLAVSNTFKSSTFVQGALGTDKTKELESCCLHRTSDKKALLYMRTKIENSGVTESSFREYYRGKGISFKVVGDPITRPLTDEEYEMYSKQKKPIELNKVKDIIDTFEITENEARFTQNVLIQDTFYDCRALNVGEEVVTIQFEYMPVEYTGKDKIVCNKLKTIPFDNRIFPQEEYISYFGYVGRIAISKSKLKNTNVETVVDYLNQHDYKILIPSKEKNKVTVIPKESTPIIPTYETNNFTFGDGIKPSAVEITVPVDRISELEAKINTKIARLEALESALIDVALDK